MPTDWNEIQAKPMVDDDFSDFLDSLRDDRVKVKRRKPKPVAKPAFDPFQEVEVVDSRHLFKIGQEEKKGDFRQRVKRLKQERLTAVHFRVEGSDDEKWGPPCGAVEEGDVLFYWTLRPGNVTCTYCKPYANPKQGTR